jgi:hypothetical protein
MRQFKQICSIQGLRVWSKGRNAKKSRLVGVSSLNYFSNGQGRKVSYVYLSQNKEKLAFDLPIAAMIILLNEINKDGPISRNSVGKRGWKLVKHEQS